MIYIILERGNPKFSNTTVADKTEKNEMGWACGAYG